ncbi:MAG: hypothetical protein PHY47_11345 [Lachnospiraceae bacterium]|nr:hypothetical protein [Lachnospiraceae bacterium]
MGQDKPTTDFDKVTTTNHIQILKTVLPYVDRGSQQYLSVYIKVKELFYTVSFFQEGNFIEYNNSCNKESSFPINSPLLSALPIDIAALLNSDFISKIKPYCNEEEMSMVNQIQTMIQAYEMYKTYSSMMGNFSDMNNIFSSGAINPEMIKQFGSFFNQKSEESQKADSSTTNTQETQPHDTPSHDANGPSPDFLMNFLDEEQKAVYHKFLSED